MAKTEIPIIKFQNFLLRQFNTFWMGD